MSAKTDFSCMIVLVLLVGLMISAAPVAVPADEPPIVDPNLIGWWNFEEGQGAVALDSSGYGHHGTLVGDPQWIAGRDGLALDLDGQGDYIDTGRVASELGIGGNAPRTIALWVRPRSFNGGGLYEMGGSGTREGFSLRTRDFDDGWQARYGGIDANFSEPGLDEWVHLAHVYGADEAEVHFNAYYPRGRQFVLQTTDDMPLRIGTADGLAFDGLIDDVRLYDRAVTRDEVEHIMYGSPLLAWNPQPVDGVLTDIARASVLRWEAGALAVAHDVYFGTDEAEVNAATVATAGIFRGRLSAEATSYTVAEQPLEWNGTYYWRVDEVDADEAVTKGKVWTFETADYLIVDDFESYNDEGNYIYFTWIDGWDNGTGSVVGYLSTGFAEVVIVHTGEQAMPFSYDNTFSPWYSEASRTWDETQDWTRFGVDTLTLYLLGYPVTFFERPSGSIVMGGFGVGAEDSEEEFRFAYQRLRGDGSIVARVDSLAAVDPGAQAGLMMRASLGEIARSVAITVTAERGVEFWYRSSDEGTTRRVTRPELEAPCWVRLTRDGDTFKAGYSTDGIQWSAVTELVSDSSVTIPMDREVCVGLVTAGDVYGDAMSAEFSNVVLTDAVTGPWSVVEIGSKRLYGGNDLDQVYIALADAAGNLTVVKHPDPLAVGFATWQRWDIPLSEIAAAGVDVTRIKQMFVGVGDRDDPAPTGEGMIHFDDIRLTRSEATADADE